MRKAVQGAWALLTNAHLSGFVTGSIYSGALKRFCVPGMNCYACPAAIGACPIGSLQAAFAAKKHRFAFYVLGWLALIGILLGRFVCGWLCLFGLIQELLYKIPTRKFTVPEKADRILRYAKYGFLAVFVVLLPIMLRDEFGLGVPQFCKWICPVGTLEGGVPLVLLNEGMRAAAHFLFAWKAAILGMILLLSVFIHRPFCKYLCPLGAFYALFQRVSFLHLEVDSDACVQCGKCAKVCKMQVDPVKNPNCAECIRCGDCVHACPQSALRFTMKGKADGRKGAAGKA